MWSSRLPTIDGRSGYPVLCSDQSPSTSPLNGSRRWSPSSLADDRRISAQLAQDGHDHACVLLEQHREQGAREWIAALVGQPLGSLKRLL